MIHSMTGFARVQTAKKDGGWVVEIRSINHRYFDCSLKIPGSLMVFENAIRDLIQSWTPRGKLTLSISQEGDAGRTRTLQVDEQAARHYLKDMRKLQVKLGLKDNLTLAELIKLPGVLTTAENVQENDTARWNGFKKILDKALRALLVSRKTEGQKLCTDIEGRLDVMRSTLDQVQKLAEGRTKAVFARLKVRLAELLSDTQMDEDRLHREAALLVDKNDITEELVRLKSHFDLFIKKIHGEGQVGRELDFLCQEMHREINTIGSKAQLFEIAREVVFLKGEVEKVREQVQNVE